MEDFELNWSLVGSGVLRNEIREIRIKRQEAREMSKEVGFANLAPLQTLREVRSEI